MRLLLLHRRRGPTWIVFGTLEVWGLLRLLLVHRRWGHTGIVVGA